MPTSIISGIISSNANKSASRAQAAAAQNATDVQERMYDQSREDLAPYREAGTAANNQLSYLLGVKPDTITTADGTTTDPFANVNKDIGAYGSLTKPFSLSDYTEDPGTQFEYDQGQKAINAADAARGGFYSGKALKEATTYGVNMADQNYGKAYDRYNTNQNNIYNRLTGVSNSGYGATNTGVQSNTQNADALGNIYGQAGNAKANAAINQGNIYNNAVSSLFGGGQSSYGGGNNSYNALAAMKGLPWSDINLKENIKPIGKENGHNVYEFNYIGEPERYRGVMAQEVMKTNPDAVKLRNGHLSVNYNKIGVEFKRI